MGDRYLAQNALEELGWEFLPDGPDGWSWFLFDDKGKLLAKAGDDRWKRDLVKAFEMKRKKDTSVV